MAKLVHSMIRVMDASRSVAFYEKAFGLSVVDKLDFESFVLIYMVSEWSAFELELTVNKSVPSRMTLVMGMAISRWSSTILKLRMNE